MKGRAVQRERTTSAISLFMFSSFSCSLCFVNSLRVKRRTSPFATEATASPFHISHKAPDVPKSWGPFTLYTKRFSRGYVEQSVRLPVKAAVEVSVALTEYGHFSIAASWGWASGSDSGRKTSKYGRGYQPVDMLGVRPLCNYVA